MAAGLKIHKEKIGLFRMEFEKNARQIFKPEQYTPNLSIDLKLDFNEISTQLVDSLESLQPFGPGNPEPVFLSENVRILSSKIVGERHRRMTLGQPDKTRKTFVGIHFNIDPEKPVNENPVQAAFRLRWNRWNGKKTIQFLIEEIFH